MESLLITSLPDLKRQPLDSVVKINNALRKHKSVFYTPEDGTAHQISFSRHRGLTFQVQIDGQWSDASIKNVWREKNAAMVDLATLSHREALLHAMIMLKARTFRAILDAGPTWQIVFQHARRWSSTGGSGDLFSTEECLQQSFDGSNSLVNPLSCAWKGNFEILAACLRTCGFVVRQTESLDQRWSQLAVSLLSTETD